MNTVGAVESPGKMCKWTLSYDYCVKPPFTWYKINFNTHAGDSFKTSCQISWMDISDDCLH